MQLARLVAVPAALAAGAPPSGAASLGGPPALVYGPGRCVSIKRQAATGTCLLRTRCPTQDIASFDFSFDCMSAAQGPTTHSLGIGSFDTEEEFDTGVECDACVPPKGGAVVVPASTLPLVSAVASLVKDSSVVTIAKGAMVARHTVSALEVTVSNGTSLLQHAHHKKKKNQVARFHKDNPEEERKWSANSQVERYGPGGCVSTWKDESNNHCMMQTDCDESLTPDLAVYEFGLLCRQEDGDTVRHVFGQNSFDEHETFDTLIECQECLALDEYMDANSAVKQLADEVSSLRTTMSGVTADLNRLNDAVLNASAPAASSANATNLMARRGDAARRSEQRHGKIATEASREAFVSHVHGVVAKAVAKVSAHHGVERRQQRRLLRHAAKHELESRDADTEGHGVEDTEAAGATQEVRRGQQKSRSSAHKAAQRHRRETEDAGEDADSDEQDEEQDYDEAEAQEEDQHETQEEDGAKDEEQVDDANENSGGESDVLDEPDADKAPYDGERSDSDA